MAISGSTIVAGARERRAEGAAYVFERSGSGWQQAALLTASSPSPAASFGSVVTLYDDTLAIGAPGAPANDLGMTVEDSGAVFVFERADGTWSEVAHIEPSRPRELNFYGIAVSGEDWLDVEDGRRLNVTRAIGGAACRWAHGTTVPSHVHEALLALFRN